MSLAGRDMVQLLLNEAKRKPKIAELVDRVNSMTDADIDAADVPLPWFRIALKRLRGAESAMGYANLMGPIEERSETVGMVLRYIGPDVQFRPPKGLQIEIKTNDLLFMADNQTWLGSVALGMPDLSCAIERSEVTRPEYILLHQPVADASMEEPGSKPLFRISR